MCIYKFHNYIQTHIQHIPFTDFCLVSLYQSLLFLFVLGVNPISAQSAQVLVFSSPCCTLHTDVKQEIKVMQAFKCN